MSAPVERRSKTKVLQDPIVYPSPSAELENTAAGFWSKDTKHFAPFASPKKQQSQWKIVLNKHTYGPLSFVLHYRNTPTTGLWIDW